MISRPIVLLAAGVLTAGVGLLTLDAGGTAMPASAADGADVFQAKGCAMCHDGPDSTAPVGVGPPLDAIAGAAGTRIDGTSAAAYIRLSVLAPQSFIAPGALNPEVPMPALPLAPEELDALVAYLLGGADG